MSKYKLSNLGISEARWNSFGEFRTTNDNTFLYSGREEEGQGSITWIDGVLSCMQEKGLEEGEWSDRERWRRMTVD